MDFYSGMYIIQQTTKWDLQKSEAIDTDQSVETS